MVSWIPSQWLGITDARKALTAVGRGVENASRGRILIVDDDPDILFLLTTLLESEGYEVFKASHGEVRSSKVLGSGNGELPRQSFHLGVPDISFVPNSATESGVAPDMDVQVAGQVWDYRDLLDPDAEGARAYSTSLREDGSLDIVFRVLTLRKPGHPDPSEAISAARSARRGWMALLRESCKKTGWQETARCACT